MKVILLDNVKKLGRRYDVVAVKPGYAHNYLIPQMKAVIADDHAMARIDEMKKERVGEITKGREELKTELAKIKGGITLILHANEIGGLYQSVTEEQIVGEIQNAYDATIPADYIIFGETSIKSVGDHIAFVTYDDELSQEISITIKAIEEEDTGKKRKPRAEKEDSIDETETKVETKKESSIENIIDEAEAAMDELKNDDTPEE